MSIPDAVGHDRRGNPVFEKTPDGDKRVSEDGTPIIDDDLPQVADEFIQWAREKGVTQ